MVNTDLDFAEWIYGGEKIWYVYYKIGNEIFCKGPFDLCEAKKSRDSYIDCDEDIAKSGVYIFVDWNKLRECCAFMFGE